MKKLGAAKILDYMVHAGVHLLERTREMLHSLLLLLLIVSDRVMVTAVALEGISLWLLGF